MARDKKGVPSKSSDSDGGEAQVPSGRYAEATDGLDWITASCFIASNGRTWSSQYVASHMHYPCVPEVEPAHATPPSQAIMGSEGAASQQRKKKKRKREQNTSSSAFQVASSSTNEANPSQQASTPASSSKAANSTGKRLSQKQARTIHPGEPPTTGATNTSSSCPLDTLPDVNASLAVSPPLPYLLVELDNGEPILFVGQYECDQQDTIPKEEVNDSTSVSPSRQLLSSDIHLNKPEFYPDLASSLISFSDIGDFDLKRLEMLSEADSAYCSYPHAN